MEVAFSNWGLVLVALDLWIGNGIGLDCWWIGIQVPDRCVGEVLGD